MQNELWIWLQYFDYSQANAVHCITLYKDFANYFAGFGINIETAELWQNSYPNTFLNEQLPKLKQQILNNQISLQPNYAVDHICKYCRKQKNCKLKYVLNSIIHTKLITKHLVLELKTWLQFFKHRLPKDHQNNELYLACINYFSKFGINLHSKAIWNKKVKDFQSIVKRQEIFVYAKKNNDYLIYTKIKKHFAIYSIYQYAKSQHNVNFIPIFNQYITNHPNNDHILYYSHHKVWLQNPEEKDNTRKKCRFCLGDFNNSISQVFFKCDWCLLWNNRCHIHDITAVGFDKNFILCPHCIKCKQWIIQPSAAVFDNIKEIVHTFKVNDTVFNVYRVLNGHLFSDYIIIGFFNEIITDRFIVISKLESATNSKINILSLCSKQFLKTLQQINNVVWKNYYINIAKHQETYFSLYKSNYSHSKWQLPKRFKLCITEIGPLRFDGFFALPNIGQQIVGFATIEKVITTNLKKIYPNKTRPIDNQIITKNCSSVYFKYSKHQSKYLLNILSLGWSYKGGITCYKLSHDSEVDANFEEEPGNHLEFYQPLHKFKPNSKTNLKVVESDMGKLLQQKYPKLINALNDLKALSSQILFAISEEIKPLQNVCTQYLKRGYVDGTEYDNVDCIIYYAGHVVSSHVDHKDLVNLSPKHDDFIKQFGPLLPGPYLVWKINLGAKPQVLCNNSKACNQCINTVSFENAFGKYNHLQLGGGSLYAMINHGVIGGVTHSIHHNEPPFGGFADESITIVLRPKTNK